MQVATFFRDSVTLMGSATNMNSSSESSFISLEEKEEKIEDSPSKDNTATSGIIPLSVSSLVNLASTVLNGNDTPIEEPTNDGFFKKVEEEDQIQNQNILIQEGIHQGDQYSKRLCNEDDKVKGKISQSFSPLSIDITDHPTDIVSQPISPHLERSLETKKLDNLYKFTLSDSDVSEGVSSSHVAAMSFKENPNSVDNTFSMQVSEGNQIQTNPHSSSIITSNIRETHGCATKISDMDKTEAENLVIHEQEHTNTISTKISRNNLDMTELLDPSKSGQCNKEETNVTDAQSQDEQQEQLNSHVHSREDQDDIINKCAKSNHYSNNHDFAECLRRDVNGDVLSNQNHQQMSNSQIDDIEKMEHMPSNINLNNHIDPLQQYHHLHDNQDHVQHQHTQQFFVHHDQQHLMQHHRHQQHHHHSDLMAYLHHQDQTAMQQPHHIRTYQHYQQQQQRLHQLSYPQTSSPQQPHKHGPLTCIDDLMIDEFHEDPNNRYKMLSPTVKHESQDDGYETSAGDVLTPNSHSSSHSMTPQHQMHSVNLLRTKCDNMTPSHQTDQDPYNFIDDEMNSNIRMVSPSSNNGIPIVLRQHNYESSSDAVVTAIRMEDQHMIDTNNTHRMQSSNTNEISGDIQTPKKRGRKKKSNDDISERPVVDGNLKPILQKERKKHDRFNGMPEEEVSKRTLPDHLANNLDIIIIGINPGLFAAYKGHHYAGPGNHFWKCLYLSGLTHEQMTAEEDYKLLKIGIGFTNMVERATKGSADLTRKEIKEGSRILLEKLKKFRPKIAVFNGKLIFEVFSGKKDFNFGRQQECVEGTDTYMWVMPSSSARCAQLPRAADKVPFYTALKKFRDYLNGLIPHIDDLECVFNDPKSKLCCESAVTGRSLSTCAHFLQPDCPSNEKECLGYNNSTSSTIERDIISDLSANQNNENNIQKESPTQSAINSADNTAVCGIILQGLNSVDNINPCNNIAHTVSNNGPPEKKKRGRPKKIKGVDGGDGSVPHKIRNTSSLTTNNNILNLTLLGANGEIPKKKRGRPKKIKIDNGITLGSDLTSNPNNNSGQVVGTNSINNDIIVTNNVKNIVCGNRCSPNQIGSHQMLTMNTCNQFNTQSMSQQQPLQNQRLFTSPMHSPDTASSYCSIGINVTTTPPTGNANMNNSNLGNNGSYHQHLGNSHPMQSHHHNHILQRAQHQLQAVPGIYLQSPNDTPQQQSKSPHYGSSHSDLSAEISAAISSDHLCESQSESSPAITAADYDRPESATNEEHNTGHDMRFSSPSSNVVDPQRVERSAHQIQHYHNIYQTGNSTQTYINANNTPTLSEARSATTSDDNIGYIVNTRTQASNSSANTPQPVHNPSQQQNLHVSDMSSKSLSGLESLVEQIPTISDNDTQNQLTSIVGSVECRLKSDSDEGYPSPASGGNDTGSSISGGLGCIYVPYSNINSSTPSPSSSVPSNSSIISPHHYPDPTYSTANTCSSTTNSNVNNINYSSLASNFSVSSLTSNRYSPNSYHTNIMAAPVVSSPHHVTVPASGNTMYMDSHLPVAVSTIYPHPYAQHTGYGAYNPVTPPAQPPTLHMPSPNYPYTYANNPGYPNQTTHHANHTTPAGYLTSHPSMFDRIKPDIGYGGY